MKLNKFNQLKLCKPTHTPQIGIGYNERLICCHIKQDEKYQTIWQEISTSYSVREQVDKLVQQAVCSTPKFTIIYSIPNHYIWQKTVYFPHYFNPQAVIAKAPSRFYAG